MARTSDSWPRNLEPPPYLRFAWRISGGIALGHTIDGRHVKMLVDVFVSRYLAPGTD
jgi:hypothetical protein